MSKYLKRSYWKRRRQVPRAWSEARYRMAHPLISGGDPGPLVDVVTLYEGVRYIAERKKLDMRRLRVQVWSEDGKVFYGRLRPHCIQYLEGHLRLAVVGGDLLAVNCGQSLRSEVEVDMS